MQTNIDKIAIGRRESEKEKMGEREETGNKGTTKVIERRGEKRTRKTTRKGKQNGTENEELAKVEARGEEKWKENVETEQKEKREGTA